MRRFGLSLLLAIGPLLQLAWWTWLAPELRDDISPALRLYRGLPEAVRRNGYPPTQQIEIKTVGGVEEFFLAQYELAPLVLRDQQTNPTLPLQLRHGPYPARRLWPPQPGPLGLYLR